MGREPAALLAQSNAPGVSTPMKPTESDGSWCAASAHRGRASAEYADLGGTGSTRAQVLR